MLKLPKQFVEFGIAEQDMVSFGSGLAAKKLLPIFQVFLVFYQHVLKNKFSIFVQKIEKVFFMH